MTQFCLPPPLITTSTIFLSVFTHSHSCIPIMCKLTLAPYTHTFVCHPSVHQAHTRQHRAPSQRTRPAVAARRALRASLHPWHATPRRILCARHAQRAEATSTSLLLAATEPTPCASTALSAHLVTMSPQGRHDRTQTVCVYPTRCVETACTRSLHQRTLRTASVRR